MKAAKNMQFFQVCGFFFLEYRFERFLLQQVVKWFFLKLEEKHLIGKPLYFFLFLL